MNVYLACLLVTVAGIVLGRLLSWCVWRLYRVAQVEALHHYRWRRRVSRSRRAHREWERSHGFRV